MSFQVLRGYWPFVLSCSLHIIDSVNTLTWSYASDMLKSMKRILFRDLSHTLKQRHIFFWFIAVKIPFEHLSTIHTLIITAVTNLTNRTTGTPVVSSLIRADMSCQEILTIGESIFCVICLIINRLTSWLSVARFIIGPIWLLSVLYLKPRALCADILLYFNDWI